MLTVETSQKKNYDARDASWKPGEKAVCNIVIFENHIVEVVFDTERQRFVSLFAAETSGNETDKFSLFSERFSNINPSISKRNIFLSVPKTMLIPNALYEKENRKSYFENQHKIEPGETLGDFPVKMIEAQMAYLYPDSLSHLNDKVSLPNSNLIPLDAAWLEVLSMTHKNIDQVNFHFNISDGFISVAVFKEGGLKFYNTFETATPEEVLYFVMFVSEQLRVNPLTDPYYYSGFILRTDETYNLLSKYIKLLKPEKRPAAFSYSMPVLDIPGYMFFNAFCTPICES